jgi:hypothetical protein
VVTAGLGADIVSSPGFEGQFEGFNMPKRTLGLCSPSSRGVAAEGGIKRGAATGGATIGGGDAETGGGGQPGCARERGAGGITRGGAVRACCKSAGY